MIKFFVRVLFFSPFFWVSFSYADIYYGDKFTAQQLGYGFDSNQLTLKERCLEGGQVFTPKTLAKVDFYSNQQKKQLRENTFGEIHGGVNLFIISGSVSTSIYHKISADSLSTSNVIHFSYETGSTTIEQRNQIDGISAQDCGDGFIYQVNYGQDIYLNAKLHFKSLEDYKKFVTTIKIRLLFYTKTKKKVKILEEYAQDAVFSVAVSSSGTLPDNLKNLVEQKKLTCKGVDIEECIDSYFAISDYLYNKNGLVQDIDSQSLVIRSVNVRGYEESGHYDLTKNRVPVSDQLTALLTGVEEQFGTLINAEERAFAFYEIETDENKREELYAGWQQAKNEREAFSVIRTVCFNAPNVINCAYL